jgi:hypothetical protein
LLNPLRALQYAIDSLKSDTELMQEETALFSQVIVHDEQTEAGNDLQPLPRSVYRAHVDKMTILCHRGYQPDSEGGWR